MADALSIYGAAVGSAAAVGAIWNIYNGIRDRSHLKLVEFRVTTRMGIFRIIFTLANAGRRPMTLKDFALESPNGGPFRLSDILELVNFEHPDEKDRMGPIPEIAHRLALRLDEGQQCNFVADMQSYPGVLKRAPKWLKVVDATGKAWKFSVPQEQHSQLARLFDTIMASKDRSAALDR